MAHERLSDDAVKKVSGPSWKPLKPAFLEISEALLSVSPDTSGVLNTFYVKYQLTSSPASGVLAVAWLKTSKHIVVGLALPEDYDSPLLSEAPAGMDYKALTKYFTVKPGDPIPTAFPQWAKEAYQHASANAG